MNGMEQTRRGDPNAPARPRAAQGVSRLPRECASILETRPKGAPGRDKPVPYAPFSMRSGVTIVTG